MNPGKDAERARLIAPYQSRVESLLKNRTLPAELTPLVQEFRWLVQEYRVSVFAQELGTALKVSPKRLDAHLDRIRAGGVVVN